MEYTVNHLARISGISTRTLRYYDKIGLLKPLRIGANSYRIYGQEQIDLLQQILFYRALDFNLEEIKDIVYSPFFDREKALWSHLSALETKKDEIELLIDNVRKTISSMKGEETMTDKEKFEGFKKELIQRNEDTYGDELREQFGSITMDASNAKFSRMTPDQWNHAAALEEQIKNQLVLAIQTGDPASQAAQTLCDLHSQWLRQFWPDGTYSREAHLGLGESYVADERFKSYYDKIADGGAVFLRDALAVYCAE